MIKNALPALTPRWLAAPPIRTPGFSPASGSVMPSA
jgi:hypothetical protein